MVYNYSKINSKVGVLHLVSDAEKLRAVLFDKNWDEYIRTTDVELTSKKNDIIRQTEFQLDEYFVGKRKYFDVPFVLTGTHFQKQVWQSLMTIPYGETISYSEQAQRIQNPKAVRAVGGANGKNNICILIPCHRVIGKNGSFTGFGGGIEIKQQLLKMEKAL